MKRAEIFIKRIKEFGLIYALRMYYIKTFKSTSRYIQLLTSRLQKEFSDEISNITETGSIVMPEKTPIWTMWWQGIDSLPEVLQVCYNSHIQHIDSNKYEYIVIDQGNYKKYVDVPPYIEYKLKLGIISFTHFSDILRIMLINKYGGLWLDITMILNSDLDQSIFNYPFYSINQFGSTYRPNGLGQEITMSKWAGFMYSSNAACNPIFSLMEACLLKYWKEYNYTIDYFLSNLLLRTAYDNNDIVKNLIDKVPRNNVSLYDLQPILNEVFDENLLRSITMNTQLFKVTQKKEWHKLKDGKQTFYGYFYNKYSK